jgi:hypothetical protein
MQPYRVTKSDFVFKKGQISWNLIFTYLIPSIHEISAPIFRKYITGGISRVHYYRISRLAFLLLELQMSDLIPPEGNHYRRSTTVRRNQEPPRNGSGSIICEHVDCQDDPPTFRVPSQWKYVFCCLERTSDLGADS